MMSRKENVCEIWIYTHRRSAGTENHHINSTGIKGFEHAKCSVLILLKNHNSVFLLFDLDCVSAQLKKKAMKKRKRKVYKAMS